MSAPMKVSINDWPRDAAASSPWHERSVELTFTNVVEVDVNELLSNPAVDAAVLNHVTEGSVLRLESEDGVLQLNLVLPDDSVISFDLAQTLSDEEDLKDTVLSEKDGANKVRAFAQTLRAAADIAEQIARETSYDPDH